MTVNSEHLTLIDVGDSPAPAEATTAWFRVIPPKDVRAELYRKIKAVRRPTGSLALPAIATTAGLHFSNTIHDSDSLMAFGLTALLVGYDAVNGLCRTWLRTKTVTATRQETINGRRAA
ncbi:hypothetical protein [Streptomyces sp. NPDC005568]|uniref:hypothetical protein n=1 Tax=Streptomyces sp. NPDC005568 TaxID=3156887 RepID=UPI0033B72037